MRNRGDVANALNFDPGRRQRTDGRFAAGARPRRALRPIAPASFALLAAVRDACCAANGVPLREPRKPSEPELDQATTLPIGSVNVTMVLLNVACT